MAHSISGRKTESSKAGTSYISDVIVNDIAIGEQYYTATNSEADYEHSYTSIDNFNIQEDLVVIAIDQSLFYKIDKNDKVGGLIGGLLPIRVVHDNFDLIFNTAKVSFVKLKSDQKY
ncbi:hypothetical protein D1115_19295 [Vibrio alfacsensis]|uniref:Peptidase A1 domain-containing protein n=1 Tax=Vibrio alfacsensis TaxID=1074311 RepID=A0ABN5PLB5_9VIBR|nr:hypothetical protein D1115_19295 [Vibrio alfacsensis]